MSISNSLELKLNGDDLTLLLYKPIGIEKADQFSAHGPIFCRKELREKVGVKVRFFLGLSQRRRPICLSQAAPRKSQRTRTDFLSELLCVTIAGPIVG